jgi:hypothetical protein
MTVLKARNLSRGQVHKLLGFQPLRQGSFTSQLRLEPLTDYEQTELTKIQNEFSNYLDNDKVSEGQIRLLSVAPLFRVAGYNDTPIYLNVEEDIERIYISDEDTHIAGRLDIVAVNNTQSTSDKTLMWVLIVESKNSEASEFAGIAQMLTYAYQSLQHQSSIWGLVTNGVTYQFFYIRQGDPHTYQYMPHLNLFENEDALRILQVLKAIREV